MIKPSESTPKTSQLVFRMIRELFDEGEIAVIQGDKREAKLLLEKPFNHIFFTGSDKIGEIIIEASSKHLSSVTLELGGKSPVIIGKNTNIPEVAQRIMQGKAMNAGQICLAPDYALINKKDIN